MVEQLDHSDSVLVHFELSKHKSVLKVFEFPLQPIAVLNFTSKTFKICGELSDFVL
jgi:hypothetical protein